MKELDLFAQQFSFDVQRGKKDRGTKIGAIISLLVLAASFTYLCYLLYRFFTHANPPTVSSTTSINLTPTSINFDYPLVQVQFNMPDGENDQNYFQTFSWLQDYSLQNQTQIAPVQLAMCSNYNYLGDQTLVISNSSYCLQPEQASLIRQSKKKVKLQRDLWVMIDICNMTTSNPLCRNDESQDFTNNLTDLLYDERFSVTLSVQLKTLDTESGNIIDNSDTRKIVLDPNTVETEYANIQRTIIKVDKGLLFQQFKTTTVVQSYEERSVFQSSDFVYNYYSEDIFNGMFYGMCITLQETDIVQNVVYEKIGSPLAQFVSILNILLVLGIVAKFVSEARIFDLLIDRYLSVYFLSTASQYKIQKGQENKKRSKKSNKNAISPEKNQDQDQISQFKSPFTSFSGKTQLKQVEQEDTNEIKNRLRIQDFIPEENERILQLSAIKSLKMQSRAPRILEQIKNGEKKEALSGLSRAEQIYSMIFEDSQRECAFTSIYGDLLALKNGLQMILNEEQYAAMQYVGRSLDNVIDNKVDHELLNHLERQERIDRDEALREELLISFIRKGQQGTFDGLNKRLYDCLVEKLKDSSIWHSLSQTKMAEQPIQNENALQMELANILEKTN